MSALLAVVQAVATTPVPVPSPTPNLQALAQSAANLAANKAVAGVPTTPPEVLQLAQLLAVVAAGAVTSIVHQLADRGRFSDNFNRLLVTLYSSAAAVATAALTGHLGWSVADLSVALTGFLAAFASATGRYNLFAFVKSFIEPKPALAETVAAEPAVS
jgi:hypothetical protein